MSTMGHVEKHYTAILVLLYLYVVNCQQHIENVALNGTCSMTQKFPDTGDCTEVIDNVTDLNLNFTNNGGIANCIITTNTNPAGCFPFWQLVLKEDFTITNITIYNRAGYPQRLTNTDVTVDGILCKRFGSDVSSIVQNDVATFQCSPPIRGTTVKISRKSDCSGDQFTLNLCEVQVWVCSKGWYGNDCNTPCSGHCSNNVTCNRYNGSCPGDCINGWYGSRCDNSCQNCVGTCVQSSGVCSACQFGWFGNDCNTPCSGHCNSNVNCNRLDGSCPQGCQTGWYGSNCNNSCPKICDSACNQSSGACFGCISGWYGSKCSYSCPVNCKGACNQSSGACFECNGTHYGHTCQEDCGHCFLKEVCNIENGHCSKCEPGWELPQCKKECNDSYYGQNCTAKCGHCSQGHICNKADGSCLSCEPGWERPLCAQECNESYYGQNCTANCGHCSQGQICNKTDGSCLSCEPGWEPPLCTQVANCARPAQSNCDGSYVGVGIGSAVSGAIVVIIAEVLLLLVYRRRRNSEKKHTTERRDQSVPDNILTNLQVQYSSGPRKEEMHCEEDKHLETTYDKLERNALYENSKEQSVYTGLSKD